MDVLSALVRAAAFLTAFFALVAATSQGPDALAPAELTRTVVTLDAELFDAYDRCDLAKFGSFLADGVEFYHDDDGLVQGKRDVIESIDTSNCGKMQRVLAPNSFEVYSIHDYGAVETGTHCFYRTDASGQPGEEAKFLILWRYDRGTWAVARIVSYDHRALPAQGMQCVSA